MSMMTKLVIVSPLVGTPGDEFTPKPGVNVQALIDGGFIVIVASEVSTKTLGKARKVKPAPKE